MWEALPNPQPFIASLNPLEQNRPGPVTAYAQPLPFYRNAQIIKLEYKAGAYYGVTACGQSDVLWLDGSSDAIREANERFGLHVDDGNVVEYMQFFCAQLVAQGSGFNVIGIIGEIEKTDEDYLIACQVEHGGQMFLASMAVEKDGQVMMLEDEPLRGRVH